MLYCTNKIFQSGKEVDVVDYLNYIFSNELAKLSDVSSKAQEVAQRFSSFLSVLLMFEGLIGFHGLGSPLKTPMEITKCDIQIQQSVEEELNKRIEDPTNPSYSERIRCWKQAIDDYCTS